MPAVAPRQQRPRKSTKCEKLAHDLRDQIARGELKPGDRLPSLVEMRSEHALSRTTVDRVHRLLEQDGLIVREQGRGTFVAQTHSPSTMTGLIGFCGWGFRETPRTPYWTHLLDGIQEMAVRENKGILLLDYDSEFGWDKVDGVLTSDVPRNEQIVGLPHVELMYARTDTASVIADDYHGAQIATEYLMGLGHRRIGCLIKVDSALGKRRVSGYRDALQSAGIDPDPAWVRPFGQVGYPDPEFRERSRRIMQSWLAGEWRASGITALLAQNDLAAMGIMDALQEAGINVPGEVSVVGFDSTEICDLVSPRLTSVQVPLREIGAMGMEILLRQIQTGRSTNSVTMLPTQLQVRESTGEAPR